jgi:hypothetical protein
MSQKSQIISFTAWMNAVDAALLRAIDMTSSDLADCAYRDWYNDDMSPVSAARLVIDHEFGA